MKHFTEPKLDINNEILKIGILIMTTPTNLTPTDMQFSEYIITNKVGKLSCRVLVVISTYESGNSWI